MTYVALKVDRTHYLMREYRDKSAYRIHWDKSVSLSPTDKRFDLFVTERDRDTLSECKNQ